jgi:large subunit ribosomal protein L3
LEVGQVIKADVFSTGDLVDVVGISKGKGFAGVVKRHGFAGGPKTHGQSDRHRAPGSIGAGTTPGRVFKGMRMPGRMGGDRTTVANLELIVVDPERNLLAVKGAIPGAKNGLVVVKEARKTKKRAG